MKYSLTVGVFFTVIVFSIIACKKESFDRSQLVSLKIVNSITGGTTARLNGINTSIANASATGGTNFTLFAGTPDIYVWPSSDSLSPYYNANKGVAMAENEYYTLFIGGTPATPEPLLMKESWQNYSDSVVGIRFVNLSPNSTPVNLTISTNTGVNQFENIAFKDITEFKKFPAASTNSSYLFQVRAAANPNTVLASVSISLTATSANPRFKNITLVFRGNVGGSGTLAPGITRVNYY